MRIKAVIGVIAFCVAVAVFSIFDLDTFVKNKIEFYGSEAVGAKVSIASLNISITKQAVTLKGLEVANPKEPFTNMFALERVAFDFSLPDALMGHILIENISVDTPTWGTKRKTSGAYTRKKKPAPKPDGKITKALKKGANKVVGKVSKEASKQVKNKFGKTNKKLKAELDWKKHLPVTDFSKSFNAEEFIKSGSMSSLKELDELAKFAEGKDKYWADKFKDLEKDMNHLKKYPTPDGIKAFRSKVEAVKKEFQSDFDRINSARGLLDKLINKDLKNIPGLGGGVGEISQKLFQDMYRQKLQTAYDIFEQYKSQIPSAGKKEDDGKKRMKGQTIHYKLYKPLPRLYIKKAEFRTNDKQKTGNWFSGAITDISSNQKLTGKPTVINMQGSSQDFAGAFFSIKGEANMLGKVAKYNATVVSNGLSTNMVSGSLGTDSPIAMTGGTAEFLSGLNLSGRNIVSNFSVTLKDIALSARPEGLKEADEMVVQILNESVAGVNYINLKGTAKGTIDNLDIHITSDLDKIFKKVFEKMIAKARKVIEEKLRKALKDEIAKRLPGIEGVLTDENGKMKNLSSIGDLLQNRIDAERKKLEDKAKAEIEKKKKAQEDKLKKEAEKKLKNLFKFK